MIKYNTYGEIIQEKHDGWFIYVEAFEDSGFQVFIANTHPKNGVKSSEGFDYYCDNVQSLELLFDDDD